MLLECGTELKCSQPATTDCISRIDNNEYSCLMDDLERFRGETSAWSSRGIPDHVRNRLSWGDGEISMGQAGRGSQTAAMARVGILDNAPYTNLNATF